MRRRFLMLISLTLVFCFCGCNKEDKVYMTGVWKEKTYVNDFANLELTIPDDWTVCSKQEINETIDNDYESIHIDAMAKNEVTGGNMVIMYENLIQVENSDIDERQYFNALKEQNTVSYSSMEIDYVKPPACREIESTYETLINGEKYFSINTTFDSLDISQTFFVRKIGNYMAIILYTDGINRMEIDFTK